jgi:class 3 adenylate cyclase
MAWNVLKYRWQWQLQSSAEELWPYVADTQRFNLAAKLPMVAFTELPLETGGSQRIGLTSKLGISVKYEDYPFEWIRGQEFSNLRVFERGPVAQTYAKLSLEPNAAGTLLKYYVEVTPANLIGFLGAFYQFGWDMRRNFERVFRQIDDYLQNQVEQSFALKATTLGSSAQLRLANLTGQLAAQNHEPRWVQRLADLLTREADLNLARLRPRVLADTWQAPQRAILEMFLSAAKLGLLNMRWDLMCPLCRGAKATAKSLDEVSKGVHCPTCNIDFEVDFVQNVELTFAPHPQIRTVHDDAYCIGGPMLTPHILVHQIIAPGETRVLTAKLAPGGYRLRTQRPDVEYWLELDNEDNCPLDRLTIQVDADTIQATPHRIDRPIHDATESDDANCDGSTLVMTNNAPYAQRIFVERSDWYTNAVTAAQVTTLQHFRDLFSDEVLRPGEEIGVQGMTILFSDLVGSTAMYNRRGDAPSYAVVREQFAFLQRIMREYDGAIVKTIGDAIMGAFSDSAKGVGAALAIQKEIAAFNTTHPDEPLKIKLGLHYGPCIAVNLNGRLDYFGTTVNLAARLEGQSQGGDVVISERLRHDPAVAELLASQAIKVTQFETAIKGFDEHFHLYRLMLG